MLLMTMCIVSAYRSGRRARLPGFARDGGNKCEKISLICDLYRCIYIKSA